MGWLSLKICFTISRKVDANFEEKEYFIEMDGKAQEWNFSEKPHDDDNDEIWKIC